MAYVGFNDLNRRKTADKMLGDKAFNFANNPKYDGYQRKLTSMVHKFSNKKSSGRQLQVEQLKMKVFLIRC